MAFATQALFFLGFGGITWGVMSTSWEESEEGTLLGVEQFKKNSGQMLDPEKARREEAKTTYMEDDAAADGVILSQRALKKMQAKQEKQKQTK